MDIILLLTAQEQDEDILQEEMAKVARLILWILFYNVFCHLQFILINMIETLIKRRQAWWNSMLTLYAGEIYYFTWAFCEYFSPMLYALYTPWMMRTP